MTITSSAAGCGKTACDGKPYPLASLCEQYTLMQGSTLYGTPEEISTPPLPKPRLDLFSPTPSVLRLISGRKPGDTSRSCSSDIPTAPMSVYCTWRILVWP